MCQFVHNLQDLTEEEMNILENVYHHS